MSSIPQCRYCVCHESSRGGYHHNLDCPTNVFAEVRCPDHEDNLDQGWACTCCSCSETESFLCGYNSAVSGIFGIIGMASAIADREADKYWEEVEKEQDERRERLYRQLEEDTYWWLKHK